MVMADYILLKTDKPVQITTNLLYWLYGIEFFITSSVIYARV